MSKGGLKVIRDLSKGVASRTLQVTVVPTPVKFQERRAVLHALQKFAHIEVFQKLDNHDASFVSVARSDSSAAALVQRSPLEYHLMADESRGAVRTFLTSAPSTDPVLHTPGNATAGAGAGADATANANLEPVMDATEPSAEAQTLPGDNSPQNKKKHFTVHLFPFPEYVHASAIRASPLHGPWEDQRQKTAVTSELRKAMPNDISADGLSDWDSGGQNPDMAKGKMIEDLLFGHKAMDPGKRAVKERLNRRQKQKNMPAVMEGLLHLREEREGHEAASASPAGDERRGESQPGT